MHQNKLNLQAAFSEPEIGKINPDLKKLEEHCRHTAINIVKAMKLIGEQKQIRKTVN